mgnify:CR=1 FL=1
MDFRWTRLTGKKLLIQANKFLVYRKKCPSKVGSKSKVLESFHQRAYELGVISFLMDISLTEIISEYNNYGFEKDELES